MNVKILGAGREVGKSSIVVNQNGKKIMLDHGVKIHPEPPSYPVYERSDALILSHAHLDHCGAIPSIFRKDKIPVYMNSLTLETTILLLLDAMKVAKLEGYSTPYKKGEIKKMIKNTKIIENKNAFKIGDIRCMTYDAGHIPGSTSILMNGEKRVFYTGDINTNDTRLLRRCELPDDVDVLITESTYGMRDHKNRQEQEKKFIESVKAVIKRGGTALVSVFAVGRSAEVMLILEEFADKIALDGMGRTATDIALDYKKYLNKPEKLKDIFSRIKIVRTNDEREIVKKRYPIILTSAGMLSGGPVLFYLKELKDNPENKIFFTGFLVEDSPGKKVLEKGVIDYKKHKYKIRCKREQYDFSAHAGRKGLLSIIKKLSPEKIICVHGDRCDEFAEDLREQGFDACGPKNDEVIKI